ncbi:MAG: PAS domain S-box protein, partial [Anaerolineae bacterium]|nr:PAS domain S-box protein [Anaerolineae bacterium]
ERARRNIIESEARYSALINASPNAIMVVQNENYTFANPTAAQMLGYNTPEEVIGLPALPTIAPTSRDLVRTRAARAQQGQFNPPIELDVLRPDGTTLTIESTSVPITLQDEPATLIIGQDISERKAAEATLRYHSTILTSLSDAVISTDLAFVIQSWNEAAEKLYGWSAADTIGQPLNQIIPTIYTDENQTEEAIIEQFMHDGFWRGEVIQSDQNGTPLYILSATSLIKDEAGQPTGVVTVNRDITDRKLAEEAERAARALSDALRDTAAALTQSLDKEEVLERILIHLRQVIPHDAASIMLVSGQTATPVRQQGYEKFNAAEIFGHFRLTPHEYPAFTEIFNTKQVQIIPDTQADPRWQYIPETEWIRSHITVPILINDEVIGIINLDSATPHAFTLDQAERTNIFADQAAVAIQNATLYAEVQQHVAQLQALHAIMLDVSGEIELNTLLDKLVKNALTLIRAQAGGIYFYRPDQDVLEWTVQVGDPAAMAPIGTKLQRGEGLAGKVWETREPIIVDDYSQWAGRLPQYDNLHFTAVIGVPIIWDRQLLGVFNAVADKPERTFSERDAQLLRLFVNQAAIAIQKARMFDELEKRVRERTTDLSIRNQIANTLSSSLDHTVILANVLKTIVDQINVSGGAIYLLTKGDQPAFTLAAAYHLADEALRWIADILPRGTRLTTNNKRSFATIDMPYNGSLAAVLRVPIWRQDQIEGLIILVSQHTRPWRNADTIMLDAIGRQIAVALHNARLYTQALRDEARIRTILQSVADGLLVFNQDGELILMNPAAEALFAFYPAERGGAFSAARRLWQWLHAQDSPQTIEFVLPIMPLTYTTEQINQQCLEQHCAFKPDDSDLAWPCWLIPNGPDAQSLRQCPVYENTPTRSLQANNAEVRDTDDHILGQVIALRDVTYFRELDDLKGMFVSTVSHELRTPLSVVLLQVSTLLRYYDRISDDERRRMVGEIQAQAHILRDLIEDILELSRFDARRSQPDKQWFDLVAHCHEVVESLSPAIEQKELDVDLSRCTGLHYIHADMNQIMRVLRNLVGNAVKYTPAGGRIALALSETGGMMRLDVSDTGIGIEPEEQARVFDRFFRAETAAHIAPGTGLGLSITREIVELHGGSIHLVSEPDRGSTFTVLLPIDREE